MEKVVSILDKRFTLYLEESVIQKRVTEIGIQISTDLTGKSPLFLSVLNGAFMFSSDLFKSLNMACGIEFIRVASYKGTESTGNLKKFFGPLPHQIKDRNIVIVEDIIDSGLTMDYLLKEISGMHPASIKVCSLLVKPAAIKIPVPIHYRCFDIPNDFIVGYGLDYEGMGRNLKHIYKLL